MIKFTPLMNLQFPFYIKLSNQCKTIDTVNNHPYLNHTIYDALYYDEDKNYNIYTSVIPCNIVLTSNAKSTAINGSVINQTLITKDDLYQYRLEDIEEITAYQFNMVFSELVSNKFLYKTITYQAYDMLNIFIYGHKRMTVIEEILIELYDDYINDMTISCYAFDYDSNQRKLMIEGRKINCKEDIRKGIEDMKKEYRMSLSLNSGEESLIISVSYKENSNCRKGLNLIMMTLKIEHSKSLINARCIMENDYNYHSVMLLNSNEQSIEAIEEIKHFYYLYMNQESIMKIPLVKKEVKVVRQSFIDDNEGVSAVTIPVVTHNKTDKEGIMYNTLHNHKRYLLDCLSSNKGKNKEEEDKEYDNSNDDDLHLNSYNDYIQTQNKITSQINADFDDSFLIENITKPIISFTITHTSLIILPTVPSPYDTILSLEVELKQANNRIKHLIKDNTFLTKENNTLKSTLSKPEEFKAIEDRLIQFEADLLAIQSENHRLIQVNSQQSYTIETLSKDKKILNVKYNKSKDQIGLLEEKLNGIEEEFMEMEMRYDYDKNKRTMEIEYTPMIDNEDTSYTFNKLNRYSESNILINKSMQSKTKTKTKTKPMNLIKRHSNGNNNNNMLVNYNQSNNRNINPFQMKISKYD